jgi:hypothetical protein
MRLRLMATYSGVPYQAVLGPDGTQVMLLSPGPPPAELGFTAATGHWRKQVSMTDLEGLWLSRPVGEYRGERCVVLDDLGDRLHVAYLGRDAARAAQLGYWEIDREVFEVVVARHDVAGLTEERVEFPLPAATFAPAGYAEGPGDAESTEAESPEAESPEYAEGTQYAASADSAGSEASAEAGPQDNQGPPGTGRPTGNGRPEENGTPTGNGVRVGNGARAGDGQWAGYGGANHESRKPDRMTAWHGSPEPWTGPAHLPGAEPEAGRSPGRRTGRKDRVSPESVFAELLSLAAIPHAAYAVDQEVPGAMCLVEAGGGFEVFSRTDDARLEVQFFQDEEAAYFYLFGVLAAEAVRSGRLAPNGPGRVNGQHPGSGPAENVSKYLRGRK